MAAPKSNPKDALVMAAILKDMGIIDYEPRVINQMLEFAYRYVTNILDDGRVFCTHAKKKTLDVDDVKLAIQMQLDRSFTTPPPRDILIEIARQRNSIPLPLIRPHCGPRLPPDRYCTTSCNYKVKPTKKTGGGRPYQIGVPFGSITNTKIQQMVTAVPKTVNLPSKSASLSIVTKGVTTPTVAIVTRPAATPTSSNLIQTQPIIKISSGTALSSSQMPPSATTLSSNLSTSTPIIVTRTVPAILSNTEIISGKRKREDDYDVV
uniref:Uncharacterized protein n=1 Tax=Strigamia maritima TaxID=126957 RepID=T1J4R5_STRMM